MSRAKIETYLEGVRTVAIAGHVNPDGDCVGSVLAAATYLRDNYPELDVRTYLQDPKKTFSFLAGYDAIHTDCAEDETCDLLILLDISSKERVGVAGPLVRSAQKTLCLDHHVTNTDSYTWFCNDPEASSACEVLYRHLDPARISKECAEALYLGIAHDTGIFQYSSTSPETMRIAASLMEHGIEFSRIIDETYYQKRYAENLILGRALMESFLMFDGRVIVSAIQARTIRFYGLHARDLDGIVAQLRNTEGVEVAVFLYEIMPMKFKVSLRSKREIDVSAVAAAFGGGGHVRAAGCTLQGNHRDVINNIAEELGKQFTTEEK